MDAELRTIAGERLLVLPEAGAAIASERDAADLVGEALSADAAVICVPAARLHPDALVLSTGVLGMIAQKLVNYRRRLVVVGDISGPVATSNALRDFVRESNRGRHVWFVDSLEALEASLGADRPVLVLLVGPKGVGKTTLGLALERELGARFVEVEAVARRVLAGQGGILGSAYARAAFDAILEEIAGAAQDSSLLIAETTGASEETPRFLAALGERYRLVLVRLTADALACEARVAARPKARQVQVPLETIRLMAQRTAALDLPWDIVWDNGAALDPPGLAAEIRALL